MVMLLAPNIWWMLDFPFLFARRCIRSCTHGGGDRFSCAQLSMRVIAHVLCLLIQSSYSGLQDLLQPSSAAEKRKHKLRRLVQSPNSFFMDVRCPGCYQMWVFICCTAVHDDNVSYDRIIDNYVWFTTSVLQCIHFSIILPFSQSACSWYRRIQLNLFCLLRSTTVFSHAQTTVICQECNSLLCQPTGGKARLTDGCSFRRKTN